MLYTFFIHFVYTHYTELLPPKTKGTTQSNHKTKIKTLAVYFTTKQVPLKTSQMYKKLGLYLKDNWPAPLKQINEKPKGVNAICNTKNQYGAKKFNVEEAFKLIDDDNNFWNGHFWKGLEKKMKNHPELNPFDIKFDYPPRTEPPPNTSTSSINPHHQLKRRRLIDERYNQYNNINTHNQPRSNQNFQQNAYDENYNIQNHQYAPNNALAQNQNVLSPQHFNQQHSQHQSYRQHQPYQQHNQPQIVQQSRQHQQHGQYGQYGQHRHHGQHQQYHNLNHNVNQYQNEQYLQHQSPHQSPHHVQHRPQQYVQRQRPRYIQQPHQQHQQHQQQQLPHLFDINSQEREDTLNPYNDINIMNNNIRQKQSNQTNERGPPQHQLSQSAYAVLQHPPPPTQTNKTNKTNNTNTNDQNTMIVDDRNRSVASFSSKNSFNVQNNRIVRRLNEYMEPFPNDSTGGNKKGGYVGDTTTERGQGRGRKGRN